jgi:hypothetical protein
MLQDDYYLLRECEKEIWESQCEIIHVVGDKDATHSLHILGHLPRQVIHWGPLRSTWSYPLESSLGLRIRSVHNKARPAATIAQRYILDNTIKTFCRLARPDQEFLAPKNCIEPYRGKSRNQKSDLLTQIRDYISKEWEEYNNLSTLYGLDPSTDELWRMVCNPDFIIPEECTRRERQILDSRFCSLEAIEITSHSTITFNRTLISKLRGYSFGEKMIESSGNKKCNNFIIHTLYGQPRVAAVLDIVSCEVIFLVHKISCRYL